MQLFPWRGAQKYPARTASTVEYVGFPWAGNKQVPCTLKFLKRKNKFPFLKTIKVQGTLLLPAEGKPTFSTVLAICTRYFFTPRPGKT